MFRLFFQEQGEMRDSGNYILTTLGSRLTPVWCEMVVLDDGFKGAKTLDIVIRELLTERNKYCYTQSKTMNISFTKNGCVVVTI